MTSQLINKNHLLLLTTILHIHRVKYHGTSHSQGIFTADLRSSARLKTNQSLKKGHWSLENTVIL